MNLLFSYSVQQDNEFAEKGYAFLGAGCDKNDKEVHVFATEKKTFKCVFCESGVKGITVHDFKFDEAHTEIEWQLCPNHAILWTLKRLNPIQVQEIRRLAGCDTFHTHGDFYDKDGKSVQPVE